MAMKISATIKTVCAWCEKLLNGDGSSPTISHGICSDCKATHFDRQAEDRLDWSENQEYVNLKT